MLIAVVGPSGAGKDTLMAGARVALEQDTRFRFVRRAITRPAEAAGEDHEALTETDFITRRDAGGFARLLDAIDALAVLALGEARVARGDDHVMRARDDDAGSAHGTRMRLERARSAP